MNDHVTLLDVTTRDGLQDEPRFVRTESKVRIVEALANAGITEIEVTSFVHPKWVPQLADADTLIGLLPRSVRYSVLIMNDKGFDRALAAFDGAGFERGSYDLVFVGSASPRHNKSNNNRTIPETLAYFDTVAARAKAENVTIRAAIACSFASPWADEKLELDTVLEMAQRLEQGGCHMISLADTIGKATPEIICETTSAVRARTSVPLSLHLHDLRGSALPNVEAGLECGIRRFEGVLAGIGGCPFAPEAPGNLDLERLADYVAARGFSTGTHAEQLAQARAVLEAALAAAEPLNRPAHAFA
ncbi:MAG TPA: hydroxymethylglutaryl-CoA lyase [Candidatus Acidoferrum sp.]|nr:hydroxymethylglutaryl-CoA lyase [Candidatus Acidoferrum sp.]